MSLALIIGLGVIALIVVIALTQGSGTRVTIIKDEKPKDDGDA